MTLATVKQLFCFLFAIACIGACRCSAKEPGDPDFARREARFDPGKDELVAWAEPWICWSSKEMVEATRMNVAPSYVVRYYVQKVSDTAGRLAHLERSTWWTRKGTVFADGSIFLVY